MRRCPCCDPRCQGVREVRLHAAPPSLQPPLPHPGGCALVALRQHVDQVQRLRERLAERRLVLVPQLADRKARVRLPCRSASSGAAPAAGRAAQAGGRLMCTMRCLALS